MGFNNSAVQAMLASGADAQQNMFDIWVTFPWNANDEVVISTRAQNFQIKEAAVGMDDRKYHGSSVKVPKTSTWQQKAGILSRISWKWGRL